MTTASTKAIRDLRKRLGTGNSMLRSFTKVDSPASEVARVLREVERRFGVAVDEVQLPEE